MTQPREPVSTVTFVDNYCAVYQNLFPEVRSFEAFKWLHLGLISEIPRKTLPAIAKAVGLNNEQALLHFLTESPWDVQVLRSRRLALILQVLQRRKISLIIDETGDKKKGQATDYVDRQYIGNLGKIENGIVSVNAYGMIEGIAFPLLFKIYKPRKRLKAEDNYKTKPQLAAEIITELQALGFEFELVLADSLYGESETFISILNRFELKFIVAIRSNHAVWLPAGQRVRYNKWKKFDRTFSNGKSEEGYIREIIFGKRRVIRYWQITTDPVQLPDNSTWYVMSNLPTAPPAEVGNSYGLRTWVEYGFKHCKNHLGWADFRVTDFKQIERWWEIVSSTYFLVSLQFDGLHQSSLQSNNFRQDKLLEKFRQHPWWCSGNGWKHQLNNLQLIIQPFIYKCLLNPWLKVFENWYLRVGFRWLIEIMNEYMGYVPIQVQQQDLYFSSA
jgi:SRSO17 transposase